MTLREQVGITPTHEIERLPVEFEIAGRLLSIEPPTMRRANAWLMKLDRSPYSEMIKDLINKTQEVSTLKTDGNERAAEKIIVEMALLMRECGGEMLDLAYDLAGWSPEDRAFVEANTNEAETIRLFLVAFFLGNRSRTPARLIAAAVSASPSDSAANDKPSGETTKQRRRTSTTTSSTSAHRSTRGPSKSNTPPA